MRECTSLLNHQALSRFVLRGVLFTQPREGDVCGYQGFVFLSPPLFFFGVSGMLAIDKYLNKKLLLNEIITSSAWAL